LPQNIDVSNIIIKEIKAIKACPQVLVIITARENVPVVSEERIFAFDLTDIFKFFSHRKYMTMRYWQ
jgi:hypothetical protein